MQNTAWQGVNIEKHNNAKSHTLRKRFVPLLARGRREEALFSFVKPRLRSVVPPVIGHHVQNLLLLSADVLYLLPQLGQLLQNVLVPVA